MVKLQVSTVEYYFIWNNKNQLIGTANDSGAITARYVYGSKSHVPDYVIKGSTSYHIITDHLGIQFRVVDDFGNVLTDMSLGFTTVGFAGCLYEVDTKLCRFGARG
ncbi:MAG: hypothetical protein NDI69_17670 [Bacteriovoracaceae bacterium]|nr:hypothetical protein [Bacteriovoracaceae bacterium]